MNWISVDERLPDLKTGRYLIRTRCSHKIHTCLAWNYQYLCNGVNIAYYDGSQNWYYYTDHEWDPKIKVTHWMELPNDPKE